MLIALNTITQGDCLDLLPKVPSGSVDMVLCDLPYGTTQNKWDSVIPFEPLWEQYRRILKPGGVVVLTCVQPFTSALLMSNLKNFRYSLVYEKSHATGHLNANRMPMRKHEDILIFGKATTYNPQKQPKRWENVRPSKKVATATTCYGQFDPNAARTDAEDVAFPTSILTFSNSTTGGDRGLHPTQKPVALWEYLIRTYTNEGDTVLDNCCGSGTTGVACQNTGRNFIQFELDPEYCEIAHRRLNSVGKEIQRMTKNKMQQFTGAVEITSPLTKEITKEVAKRDSEVVKTPPIVFADLPLISKLPPVQMTRAQELLEELDTIKQINAMNQSREEEVEAELEEIQREAGLVGLRWGPWAFAWRMMEGRKTLSAEKLIEAGVSAEVIERCKVQGKGFAKREFRNLGVVGRGTGPARIES